MADILDLLALHAAWGTDPSGPPDFDGDRAVGILNLMTLLANWGPCPEHGQRRIGTRGTAVGAVTGALSGRSWSGVSDSPARNCQTDRSWRRAADLAGRVPPSAFVAAAPGAPGPPQGLPGALRFGAYQGRLEPSGPRASRPQPSTGVRRRHPSHGVLPRRTPH